MFSFSRCINLSKSALGHVRQVARFNETSHFIVSIVKNIATVLQIISVDYRRMKLKQKANVQIDIVGCSLRAISIEVTNEVRGYTVRNYQKHLGVDESELRVSLQKSKGIRFFRGDSDKELVTSRIINTRIRQHSTY